MCLKSNPDNPKCPKKTCLPTKTQVFVGKTKFQNGLFLRDQPISEIWKSFHSLFFIPKKDNLSLKKYFLTYLGRKEKKRCILPFHSLIFLNITLQEAYFVRI